MVTCRDSLAAIQIRSELFKLVFKAHGAKLVIIGSKGKGHDPDRGDAKQLAKDPMAIVHIFSCGKYRKGKYGKKL